MEEFSGEWRLLRTVWNEAGFPSGEMTGSAWFEMRGPDRAQCEERVQHFTTFGNQMEAYQRYLYQWRGDYLSVRSCNPHGGCSAFSLKRMRRGAYGGALLCGQDAYRLWFPLLTPSRMEMVVEAIGPRKHYRIETEMTKMR